MITEVAVGSVFTIAHPFLRCVWVDYDEDGPSKELSWKPGVEFHTYDDDTYAICHGVGSVIYSVVDVHKMPRPYPTRVFYTRAYVGPDGRKFGKKKLHMMTLAAFKRRVSISVLDKCGIYAEDVEDLPTYEKAKLLAAGPWAAARLR